MPQMSPISWTGLFILFTITYLGFNMMNYFSYIPPSPQPSQSQNKYSTHTNNWKW